MTADNYSLYIVRCSDGALYTGIARDVDRRIGEHENGRAGAKFLRGRKPLTLVFTATVGSRAEAQRLECRVKRLPRRKKLELVSGELSLAELTTSQTSGSSCG